jgi:vancomycin resistance protein VanJ
MPNGWKFSKLNTLLLLAWTYLALLFAWGAAQSIWGDGRGWLFLLNVAAVYLFIPAPIVLLLGVLSRRWSICVVALVACCWWGMLFGKLYLPRSIPAAEGVALNVMTYNILVHNTQLEEIVKALDASDADVVVLYELHPQQAAAINESLAEKYPYRLLDPHGSDGVGVISRYPLKLTDQSIAGFWIGIPRVYEMDVAGQTVTIVCAHPHASNVRWPWRIAPVLAERDASIEAIKQFAQSHKGPLLVPLDLNSTPLNRAYKTMTSVLADSWQEAGYGLGNTFPGAASPGSSRPRYFGILMPQWVIRIDYVFHSHHFTATEARIGPWDGYSDHRPVMARLVLKEN